MKYTKKPVTIDATRWFKNGDHPLDGVGMEAPDGCGGVYERIEGLLVRFYRHPSMDGQNTCKHCADIIHNHGWIDTLEGGHVVCPGDWIITGVKGEFYPCKPDVFEMTYSLADPQ